MAVVEGGEGGEAARVQVRLQVVGPHAHARFEVEGRRLQLPLLLRLPPRQQRRLLRLALASTRGRPRPRRRPPLTRPPPSALPHPGVLVSRVRLGARGRDAQLLDHARRILALPALLALLALLATPPLLALLPPRDDLAMHVLQERVRPEPLLCRGRHPAAPAQRVSCWRRLVTVEQAAPPQRAEGVGKVAHHQPRCGRRLPMARASAVQHARVGIILLVHGVAVLVQRRVQALVLDVPEVCADPVGVGPELQRDDLAPARGGWQGG